MSSFILKMKDMTAQSDADLCPSCAYSTERRGQGLASLRTCGLHGSFTPAYIVRGRVTDCSGYYPKSLPSLNDMQQVAWEIVSKGERGGRSVGFISPEDRRKAGIGMPAPPLPGQRG